MGKEERESWRSEGYRLSAAIEGLGVPVVTRKALDAGSEM